MGFRRKIGIFALLSFGCKTSAGSDNGGLLDHGSDEPHDDDYKNVKHVDAGFLNNAIDKSDFTVPDADKPAWYVISSTTLTHCDMVLYAKHKQIDNYYDARLDMGRRLLKGEAQAVVGDVLTYAMRGAVKLDGMRLGSGANGAPMPEEAIAECENYLAAIQSASWGCNQWIVADYVTYLWKAQLSGNPSPKVQEAIKALPFKLESMPFFKVNDYNKAVSTIDKEIVGKLATLAGLEETNPNFYKVISNRSFKAYSGMMNPVPNGKSVELDGLKDLAVKFLGSEIPNWHGYPDKEPNGDTTFYCTDLND